MTECAIILVRCHFFHGPDGQPDGRPDGQPDDPPDDHSGPDISPPQPSIIRCNNFPSFPFTFQLSFHFHFQGTVISFKVVAPTINIPLR